MKLNEKIDSILKDEKKQNIILWTCIAVIMLLWLPLALTKNLAYDQGYTIAMVRHSFGDIIRLSSFAEYISGSWQFLLKKNSALKCRLL